MNYVPLSKTITIGRKQYRQQCYINYFTIVLASIFSKPLATTPFLSLSTTTIIFRHPSDLGRLVIKSIKISNQIRLGISNGFKNPRRLIHYDLFCLQPLYTSVKVRISFDILSQKNYQATKAYVPSLLGQPLITESCICQVIRVRRLLLPDSTYLFS